MAQTGHTLKIDQLIEIVQNGGTVKTGVDIYSKDTILLLDKDVLINTVRPLLIIKQNGIEEIPINPDNMGGIWDRNGRNFLPEKPVQKPSAAITLKERVEQIAYIKREAAQKHLNAKNAMKKIVGDVIRSGGEFDREVVEDTVTDLCHFIGSNEGAFFYLAREIFSHDEYLYNHSVNVCTFGTAIMKKAIQLLGDKMRQYSPQDLIDISTGFFLHDIGKILVPFNVLNKPTKLTPEEFEIIREHSYNLGNEILLKNNISSRFVRDIVRYHHGALYEGELRFYPHIQYHSERPPHVRVSKLADIYDAMTSKRCYKDAMNPATAVTHIVRRYAGKEDFLQLLLHAFAKSVGIYPAGSVVPLMNRQLAYVLDSDGPIVLPFTDDERTPLQSKADPIDLADQTFKEAGWKINDAMPLLSPVEAYHLLPEYLK